MCEQENINRPLENSPASSEQNQTVSEPSTINDQPSSKRKKGIIWGTIERKDKWIMPKKICR